MYACTFRHHYHGHSVTLGAQTPVGYSSCPVCLPVCVCEFFCHAGLICGCLKEGISGLGSTFVKKLTFSLKLFRCKVRSAINLSGPSQLESAILFTLQCFIYLSFYVHKARAIMLLHKHVCTIITCFRFACSFRFLSL